MATETLGARIMDAAWQWRFAHALYGEGTKRESEDRLRALCDHASVAERLAVTIDALGLYICDDEAIGVETNQALAAWRALGEVG